MRRMMVSPEGKNPRDRLAFIDTGPSRSTVPRDPAMTIFQQYIKNSSLATAAWQDTHAAGRRLCGHRQPRPLSALAPRPQSSRFSRPTHSLSVMTHGRPGASRGMWFFGGDKVETMGGVLIVSLHPHNGGPRYPTMQ